MQRFYKKIAIDFHNKNFYKECDWCKERIYATKLPLLCRGSKSIKKLELYKGNRIYQKLYNRKKVQAKQYLARHFNQCTKCGKWVCNDCYHVDVDDGICSECFLTK